MTEKIWMPSTAHLLEWQTTNQVSLPNDIIIRPAVNSNLDEITDLVSGQDALVGVGDKMAAQTTILEFINNKRALVALNHDGQVVSFQGLGLWPTIQMCELRSAVTDKKYLGLGINTVMKRVMLFIAHKSHPGWKFVGFTEATSKSRGILTRLGFTETSMLSVRQDLTVLGEACPNDDELPSTIEGCFIRCQKDCGCKVYLLDPNK
jgi:hypothetical protein